MGSKIEINDTLQITKEQGFPVEILNLEKHNKDPIELKNINNQIFEFNKEGARIFHLAPTRNFLVQNLNGKWIYWGKIIIIEQNIKWNGKKHTTSGKFKIIEIYEPEYQKQITKKETNKGKSYF